MEEFEKSIKISFELNDIESIRSALQRYQNLLKDDKAVEDDIHQVEFVKLIDGEIHPLQKTDGNFEDLNNLSIWGESDLNRDEISFDGNASDTIMFSHALKFPELKDEIIATAKEIVAYSRRKDDTSQMWQDDLCVFGIEALYLLGLKMPEYAYLIGGYLIPSWDSEHADYALIYGYEIIHRFGFDKNMLKMFSYCDNWEARAVMLGGDIFSLDDTEYDLASFFEDNPEKYEEFKEIMIERAKDQPFIEFTEDDHTWTPVHSFYETILMSSKKLSGDYDPWDLPPEAMEESFMGNTFHEEATLLWEKIQSVLG
ncbi:MAG: hypothetical protein N4A57_16780 [Anaeromicrobium sp.]|jgi:hypothetical protein|uniref:hypothetical protein n=1 Tax=Anaeromicrobium sp. TaxID=1929132 RepID=UPI0025FED687|nr:hypothetical protein [Anaeromicrobium sp.]MCT4595904.1 hypothetical protein [Anaeromicrobium sp.]